MRSSFLGIVIAALACLACQQPEPHPSVLNDPGGGPSPRGGGPGGDAAADSASADGGSCPASLQNNAPVVVRGQVDTAVPAPLAGTIGTGTYYLTADNVYTGAGGTTGSTGQETQETLFLDVSSYQAVEASGTTDAGLGNSASSSGAYATSGPNLSLTATCPPGAGLSGSYTVSGSVLHFYVGSEEFVFTLQ
jgi:hypothetical protein